VLLTNKFLRLDNHAQMVDLIDMVVLYVYIVINLWIFN